jgi:chromosomal replication initiation ATPase DnaA
MKNEIPEFNLEDLNQKIFVQDEIIALAKENSPRLLNKFRLVYPDFFDKLSAIQANLKNSELIFCIYLKLNLSTKEIATYTFVTPKAIQNRKNRLRKKLSIPSEMDIYKWFNDL